MTLDLNHRLDLVGQILYLLRERPEGLSKYQLIQLLKARHSMHVPRRELTDKLALFRTHFLLFNALYHLHGHLWAERETYLKISPLSLRLHPYVDGMQALEQGDPLRDHCLSLRYLEEISEADIGRLLQSLWTRMQGSEGKAVTLTLLELGDAVGYPAIKLRYRQLVSQHHLNRGGNTVRLRSINKAVEILQHYYDRP